MDIAKKKIKKEKIYTVMENVKERNDPGVCVCV